MSNLQLTVIAMLGLQSWELELAGRQSNEEIRDEKTKFRLRERETYGFRSLKESSIQKYLF